MATKSRKTAPTRTQARKAPAPRRASAKAAPAAAAPAKPVEAKGGEADKPRKVKVLRDSFTMPKSDFAVLQALKERALHAGRPAKKSEVLRAGVRALAEMGDAAFLDALSAVPAVKTGRPAKA